MLMLVDKIQSKNKGFRIPESYLFIIAILLGAFGIYAGMKYPFYHKSSKRKFKISIPILLILNLISVYFIYKEIIGNYYFL